MARLSPAEREAIAQSQTPPALDPVQEPSTPVLPNEAYPEPEPEPEPKGFLQGEIVAHNAKGARNYLVLELAKVIGPALLASANPGTIAGLISGDKDDIKRMCDATFNISRVYADAFEALSK